MIKQKTNKNLTFSVYYLQKLGKIPIGGRGMNKKTKKFFVLKNFRSQYIDQAIFGLLKKTPETAAYNDVVDEAERIIESYMENLGYVSKKEKIPRKTFNVLLINTLIFAAVLSAAYIIVKLY
jgi:hypothetical protein